MPGREAGLGFPHLRPDNIGLPMNLLLDQLTAAVPDAASAEELTRRLLGILGQLDGVESTYLAVVDREATRRRVLCASNVGALHVGEGLELPWDDADSWADCAAVESLGIVSQLGTPVQSRTGELLGTLHVASSTARELGADTPKLLRLFAELIANWLERERLVAELAAGNERLARDALVDALTGLPNRRAILETLTRALAQARRDGTSVLVGLVDMDGFKRINDAHGHQVGDLFLRETAQRLRLALRDMDAVGRLGGDEFGLVAPGSTGDSESSAKALRSRIAEATVGDFELGPVHFSYGGASVGVVAVDPRHVDPDEAFRRADDEMYRVKRERRLKRRSWRGSSMR
jgi:diguanylate cyclase